MRYVVILAGGSGKRLWPLSRQGTPKQLLSIVEGRSLLRIAFERIQGVVPDDQVFVCTGADYIDAVRADLPEVPSANILGEPVGRDSLNAVAWPAAVLAGRDPDAVVAVLSSDHIMHPVTAFREAVREGFEVAEADDHALVTFGVVPTQPHTGFGYLQRGEAIDGHPDVCRIERFVEKPDRETAERYLAAGDFWWNSGMFVWRAATLLRQLELLTPLNHAMILDLAQHPERVAEIYPELDKVSVDYAVMEPVSEGKADAHVVAVRLPITWHDVGGFAALGEHLPRDAANNALQGLSVLVDSHDNLVFNSTPDRIVAVVGLTDTVIVQTAEITLVCPMDQSERIKELVAEVIGRHGELYA